MKNKVVITREEAFDCVDILQEGVDEALLSIDDGGTMFEGGTFIERETLEDWAKQLDTIWTYLRFGCPEEKKERTE